MFDRIDTATPHTSKSNVVRKFSEANGLKCHKWPVSPNVIRSKYDLGIVVSFGHLIPEEIIDAFPL